MEKLDTENLKKIAGGFDIDKSKLDSLKEQGRIKISGINIQVKCPECNNGWISASLIKQNGRCDNCNRYFDRSSVEKYKSSFGL